VSSDAPLHEVMQQVASSSYPVPVVDRSGKFCGTISKTLLLETLSTN